MLFLKKYWLIFVGILFVLAVILGLVNRAPDFEWLFGENKTTVDNPNPKSKSLLDFYNEAQQLTGKQPTQASQVSFLAVGDIMLSRNVAGEIKKSGDPLLPFRTLDDLFENVDFSFGNLESPFSDRDDFNPSGSLVFNAPKSNIQGLVENKFKILSLANNHALDQGADGLKYTAKYLDDNQIKHVGAGENLDAAWTPALIEQNGIKICFIGASYSSINDSGKALNNYVARIQDTERLKTTLSGLRPNCDFIVAAMHAGIEYTTNPHQPQIDFAHAAIDSGADMVIGHHPHWVQTIEKYNGKYIFYSLGNFIFDQMWSQETREGLALKIQISKNSAQNPLGAATLDDLQGQKTPAKLESIELLPIIIDNYSTPRLANPDETKKILDKINVNEAVLH